MIKLASQGMVKFHPHARERLLERGAIEAEVIATVEGGEGVMTNETNI